MHKEFYIGQRDDVQAYRLDLSSFTSLEQLTRSLADVFAFADPKCAFMLASEAGKHTHVPLHSPFRLLC